MRTAPAPMTSQTAMTRTATVTSSITGPGLKVEPRAVAGRRSRRSRHAPGRGCFPRSRGGRRGFGDGARLHRTRSPGTRQVVTRGGPRRGLQRVAGNSGGRIGARRGRHRRVCCGDRRRGASCRRHLAPSRRLTDCGFGGGCLLAARLGSRGRGRGQHRVRRRAAANQQHPGTSRRYDERDDMGNEAPAAAPRNSDVSRTGGQWRLRPASGVVEAPLQQPSGWMSKQPKVSPALEGPRSAARRPW